MKTTWIWFAAFSISLVIAADLDTLELVQILYRHGDRAPTSVFPTDTHKDFWTDGLGQLSNIGKEQQYELGLYIRQRYNGFLNASYNHQDVLVNSSGSDRCLMSAACNLAGLYAPVGEQVWNPNIDWQPIPIFTLPEEVDYICGTDAPCPKYDELFEETKQSPEMQAINAENADLYALVSSESGSNVTDIFTLNKVFDTLYCEQCHNLSWPDWVESVWPRMVECHNQKFVYSYKTPEEQRLKAGPLLGYMVDNMDSLISGDLGRRRALIYSSHDSMVAAFLNLLGIFNNLAPPYASTVFVELHRTPDGQHAVQIAYKNTTGNGDPEILTIPECTELCPFDQFVNLTASGIPDDILTECQVTPALLSNMLSTRRRSGSSSLYSIN